MPTNDELKRLAADIERAANQLVRDANDRAAMNLPFADAGHQSACLHASKGNIYWTLKRLESLVSEFQQAADKQTSDV